MLFSAAKFEVIRSWAAQEINTAVMWGTEDTAGFLTWGDCGPQDATVNV